MYVYCITNCVTNRRLVGQTARTVDERWLEHVSRAKYQRHENPYFQRAWNKYGESRFQCSTLHEAASQQELDEMEEYYRQQFAPNVYNLRTGGGGGCEFHESTRRKMAEAHRGKVHRESTRQKLSEAVSRWRRTHDVSWSAERKKRRSQKYRPEGYQTLVAPDGAEHEVDVSLSAFCDTHQLNWGCMCMLVNGQKNNYLGWHVKGQIVVSRGDAIAQRMDSHRRTKCQRLAKHNSEHLELREQSRRANAKRRPALRQRKSQSLRHQKT